MAAHVHIGALQGLITFAYIIIFGFLWRITAAWLSDTQIGKAMSFIY